MRRGAPPARLDDQGHVVEVHGTPLPRYVPWSVAQFAWVVKMQAKPPFGPNTQQAPRGMHASGAHTVLFPR